jgi:hypothetical protein
MVCPLCTKSLFKDGTHQIISSCNYSGSVMTREEILRACEDGELSSINRHLLQNNSNKNAVFKDK